MISPYSDTPRKAPFERLVRFEHGETVSYGNLVSEEKEHFIVQKLRGDIQSGFEIESSETLNVSKLLCPIDRTPLIICIGLNYMQHAKEANLPIPTYPVVFTKPADALAGPYDNIPIHKAAQSHLDYEGELTFVTSRDIQNLPSEDFDLSDYILGYTAGNDVSARNFQLPEASGGQFCYSKSFDSFAPIGNCLVSPAVISDPQKLKYITRVNGEIRQSTGTDDMIWTVKEILRHLSQGTTVRAGTVVMTGTPSGVGYFQKRFLKHGDVVEVEVEGVAKIVNTIDFQ